MGLLCLYCVANGTLLFLVSLISSTAKAAQCRKELVKAFMGAVVMWYWQMAQSGGCWWVKLFYVNVNCFCFTNEEDPVLLKISGSALTVHSFVQ